MTARPALVLLLAAALLGLLPAPAQAETVRQQQWWLDALGTAKAQQLAKGDGILVAVIDTGVDATQADLSGALVAGAGFNGATSAKGFEDPDGHGTQMASVLAGRGGNGPNHVLGIAPRAKVMPLAIPIGNRGTAGGTAATGTLAEPIRYAADHGAKIISMSFTLADDEPKPAEAEAIAYARSKGVILVAAGGNRPQGDDHVPLPARYDGVVTVAGTARGGGLWDGSIADPAVDIAAPAQDIIGAAPKARYSSGFAIGSGTSGAAAIVSGVLALIWSKFPALDAEGVLRQLYATARDQGPPGRDDGFGHGIVDPYAALTLPLTSPSPSPAPLLSSAPPVTNGPVERPVARAARVAVVGGVALLVAFLLFVTARVLLRRR